MMTLILPEVLQGKRPDRAVIVYSNIIKRIYPDCPVIIGGLEASLADLLIMIIGMTQSDRVFLLIQKLIC